MATMTLEILTPETTLFNGEISSVVLPGLQGMFTIMPHHAPLIASLKKGEMKYTTESGEVHLDIFGGMLEVADNLVTICLDSIG